MTNERKFLNSNVSAYEFSMAFNSWCLNNKGLGTSQADKMQLFLNNEAKPLLTDNEKVILRNMRNYTGLGRDEEGCLYFGLKEEGRHFVNALFGHLFQFIKER